VAPLSLLLPFSGVQVGQPAAALPGPAHRSEVSPCCGIGEVDCRSRAQAAAQAAQPAPLAPPSKCLPLMVGLCRGYGRDFSGSPPQSAARRHHLPGAPSSPSHHQAVVTGSRGPALRVAIFPDWQSSIREAQPRSPAVRLPLEFAFPHIRTGRRVSRSDGTAPGTCDSLCRRDDLAYSVLTAPAQCRDRFTLAAVIVPHATRSAPGSL